MLRKLRRDKRGVLYIYGVLILALAAGIFFAFMFMNLVEKIQTAVNPMLAQENWAGTAQYDAFYYAAQFVTNVWTYIVGFIVFVVAYWAWIYSQKRNLGYS